MITLINFPPVPLFCELAGVAVMFLPREAGLTYPSGPSALQNANSASILNRFKTGGIMVQSHVNQWWNPTIGAKTKFSDGAYSKNSTACRLSMRPGTEIMPKSN